MNQLQLFNPDNGKKTMSSREIAEYTEKNHQHVLRDCDTLNEYYEKMSLSTIGQSHYKADNGQFYREYLLTKMQTMDLMTGYRIDLRIKVNRRWEELETASNSPELQMAQGLIAAQKIIENKTQQLQMLQGENQHLTNEVKVLAPKAAYTDEVLQSTTTYTMTQLAKELDMTECKLKKILIAKRIVYNQSGQWMLHAKYTGNEYTKPRTHKYYNYKTEKTESSTITVWTEKGRQFIHSLFDNKTLFNQ